MSTTTAMLQRGDGTCHVILRNTAATEDNPKWRYMTTALLVKVIVVLHGDGLALRRLANLNESMALLSRQTNQAAEMSLFQYRNLNSG